MGKTPLQHKKIRQNAPKASRSRKTLKRKKKIQFKGPSLLRDNWNIKETVRQNYKRLGILPTLNPRQSGGIQTEVHESYVPSEVTLEDLQNAAETSHSEESDAGDGDEDQSTAQASIQPNLGRIIRDEQGNVVGVELPESEKNPAEVSEVTPWGVPLETLEANVQPNLEYAVRSKQGLQYTEQGGAPVEPKTEFVRQLEKIAEERNQPTVRYGSEQELLWLDSLVQRHGTDLQAMSRDIKLNPYQKSVGQIKRAFKKAGSLDAFL